MRLAELIAGARAAAGVQPVWVMDGARACPLDWSDCSQPVFRDAGSDAWDYGEPGGPGWDSCKDSCSHGMQHAPIYDDDDDEDGEGEPA